VLYRPLMAANDEGLWIGNSLEGGTCSGCSPPSALYYVAPGSDKTVVAIPSASLLVCWITAAQDQLWVAMGTERGGCSTQTIWGLDGTDFQPTFEVPDQGYLPYNVIGDESEGLWTMQWAPPLGGSVSSSPRAQDILSIDPKTGAEDVVARLPAIAVPVFTAEGLGLLPGQAVIFDGSMYLLEPPFEEGVGYSSL